MVDRRFSDLVGSTHLPDVAVRTGLDVWLCVEGRTMEEIRRDVIMLAWCRCAGDPVAAAERLGIDVEEVEAVVGG